MNERSNSIIDDKLLKEAASLYITKQGGDLLAEAISADSLPVPFEALNRVSEKIKIKQRNARIKKITAAVLPAAACFVFLITYFILPGTNPDRANAPNAPSYSMDNNESYAAAKPPPEAAPIDSIISSETTAVEFLTSRLPQGFSLTETDLDNGQMICRIEGGGNKIILIMEEWQDIVPIRPMTQIYVNGASMDALRMNDYSLLTYKKGDLRFTLTCPYDYRDLIVIGGLLL